MSLVVAVAKNRVIGRNNELPWRLSNDLRYFKKLTTGKVVMMGRLTYESIGKPLPNRINLVITRQDQSQFPGATVAPSVEAGLQKARELGCQNGNDEVMVIGGAQIYACTLPKAQRLYLTEVQEAVEGDALFPELNDSEWKEMWREDHLADNNNQFDYSFVVLERR